MVKIQIKKIDQISHPEFLAIYRGIPFHDEDPKKIYTIHNKYIEYLSHDGFDLIENPDGSNGTSTGHKYIPNHDDFFLILEKQNVSISLKIIPKIMSSLILNLRDDKPCIKTENNSDNISFYCTIQRKSKNLLMMIQRNILMI